MPALFDPLRLGSLTLPNRVLMAPMTRGRATEEGLPTPLMAEYYAQRASAGLIITEGVHVSPQARGWVGAPRIYTDAHEAGWRPVAEAIHAAGGRAFMQLWHMGRASHPDLLDGDLPVAPSAIAGVGRSRSPRASLPYPVPRALEASELPGIAADFARAARRAVAAGFDGVEIHGANGYLLDEFVRDGANQRTDAYGGSIARRWRFPLELVEAVATAIGPERTAVRFSPTGAFGGMSESDPVATYRHGLSALSGRGLAFVHLVAPVGGFMLNPRAPDVVPALREAFEGVLVINGGFDAASAQAALDVGRADAIAFGVPFLANPDLPARLRSGAPLNPPVASTFYTPGPEGYTDYPPLEG